MKKISILRQIGIQFPKRLQRLIYHFTYLIPGLNYKLPASPSGLLEWGIDLVAYINDLIGVSDVFHFLHIISKRSFRQLSDQEISRCKDLFGDSIEYSFVWKDDCSRIGLKKLARAYVLYNTINYREQLDFPTFAHEMVHIWQFQNLGSIYLGRALIAQSKSDTYEIGGFEQLYNDMLTGKKLLDYNFEQQGAIMEYLVEKEEETKHQPILTAVRNYYLAFFKEF